MVYIFFIVALLYSMVGFGGGSSYIAFLVLFDYPYTSIPSIALACNIVVVSGGTYHFYRKKLLRWELLWPFVAGSIPAAFLGGRLSVSQPVFMLLLAIVLILSGARLLLLQRQFEEEPLRPLPLKWALIIGVMLGLMAGMVGIGGGIFLAPVMLNLRWATPKNVAATCSAFILANSLAGLGGQMMKQGWDTSWLMYGWLLLAVFLGGQIGSRLGSGVIPQRWVRTLTAVLVLFVGGRVLFRWLLTYL